MFSENDKKKPDYIYMIQIVWKGQFFLLNIAEYIWVWRGKESSIRFQIYSECWVKRKVSVVEMLMLRCICGKIKKFYIWFK